MFSLLFLSISKKKISIKKHSLKSFKRIANDRNPVIGRSIAEAVMPTFAYGLHEFKF